ncbi:hypothetical protein B0T18DRAFT_438799 [Schizothecium vesticola]|uniref:Complex 1 LYR protein domain-containing protein n=1 Tax=Schizothecium vesticola TaxID=314040 RepID=A0AA40EXE3_9PEZI|nr:hypothetical protein B0T18DRAFT_438799 [Schizothecium vesticola]
MSRPPQLARPSTPLHLYRHLLRESSYLPPYARPFFDGRIKARFRNHSHSVDIKTPLKQAHHALRYFRAALLGDRDRMRRLLHMAFGRLGERRRMLLNHLVMPDAPSSTASLEEYMKEATAKLQQDREPDWLDKWNLDRLMVFARSQARRKFNKSPRPDLQMKQLDMDQWATGTSIWGKPIVPKLARSRLRKAWAAVATRILPPIPKSEWELLRDLSLGRAPASAWELPPRRPLAPRLAADDVKSGKWNWEAYASKPIAAVEMQKSRRFKLLGGDLGTGSPADPTPLGRHNYTPKSWRRLLHSIWALTPTMENQSTGDGWDIVWGGQDFKPPPATADHGEFFQDVPDTPQKQKTKRR